MGGIRVYNVDINSSRLKKGMSAVEFNSWLTTVGNGGREYHRGICKTFDGGYVGVGYQTSQPQGIWDAFLVKYNADLSVDSQHSLGKNSHDIFYSIIQIPDGSYVTVGETNSPTSDALIVKYDSNFNLVTQKSLGISNSYDTRYRSVIRSSDGGYIAVGSNRIGDNTTDYEALIVKYDSNLNVVASGVRCLTGTNHTYYTYVVQSHDGGYIAVGYQRSEGQGSDDALIVKYNSDLSIDTQHGLGGTSADRYEYIIQTNDGGYLAVGDQGSDGPSGYSAMIVKYDANLNVTSQRGLGGGGNDRFYSVIQTSDGGYLAVGDHSFGSLGSTDSLIAKYDSNLNLVSQHGLGGIGEEEFFGVVESSDGDYIVAGYQESDAQGSNPDALISRLPNDLSSLTGSFINHPDLQWTTPTLVANTTSLVEYTPSLTHTARTLVEATTTLIPTTLNLTVVRS